MRFPIAWLLSHLLSSTAQLSLCPPLSLHSKPSENPSYSSLWSEALFPSASSSSKEPWSSRAAHLYSGYCEGAGWVLVQLQTQDGIKRLIQMRLKCTVFPRSFLLLVSLGPWITSLLYHLLCKEECLYLSLGADHVIFMTLGCVSVTYISILS